MGNTRHTKQITYEQETAARKALSDLNAFDPAGVQKNLVAREVARRCKLTYGQVRRLMDVLGVAAAPHVGNRNRGFSSAPAKHRWMRGLTYIVGLERTDGGDISAEAATKLKKKLQRFLDQGSARSCTATDAGRAQYVDQLLTQEGVVL